jgi:uncharacterized protein YhjY with autotransporter beta-barrel domain
MKSIQSPPLLAIALFAHAACGEPAAVPAAQPPEHTTTIGSQLPKAVVGEAYRGNLITLLPAALLVGAAGAPYQQVLAASGGSGPYTYAITSGGLPAGLSLSSVGAIIGTPSIAGKARFSITTTDLDGTAVTRSYALVIKAASNVAPAGVSSPSAAALAAMANTTAGTAFGMPVAPTWAVPSDGAGSDNLDASVGARPDPSADAVVGGLQTADTEALKRLSAAQLRNVMARLDSDGDCRPEWEQRIHLNTTWRDARPGGVGSDAPPPDAVDKPVVCTRGLSTWAAGGVDYGRVAGASAATGSRFSSPGVTLGMDRALTSGLRSGVALGHGQDRSEVGDGAGRMDSRTDSITAYGSWRTPLDVRLDAALGQARTTLDMQRTPSGDTLAVQGQRRATQRYGAVTGSARFDLGAWRFAPRMAVEHTRASVDAYAESDDAPLALLYDGMRLASSNLRGGLALSRQWGMALWKVEPELSVDWNRRLQGSTTQAMRYVDDASGASYTLSSAEPTSELAQLGLGVRMQHPTGWLLSVGARSALSGGSMSRSAGYSASMLWPF